MVSPNVPRAINSAPQPDAGHAHPAPASAQAAADACAARAVELALSVPALNATGRPCTCVPDQPGCRRSRLKYVERPTGLGHNPGHNHLGLDPESRK
jgi:hypothetical protein